MINLEKVMTWFCIFASVWLAMFVSHQMTMNAVREELAEMVIPMHEPEYLPSANPNLDSIAWCMDYKLRN
jgi:hypothetical protein|tara:strand:- start:10989 stop:11198 length:210 start_codon:yes stop_codon:yes gene_type:complete